MKTLLFLLLSLSVMAQSQQQQGLTLKKGEVVTLTASYYPYITTNGDARIVVSGNTTVGNYNGNSRGNKIIVPQGFKLEVTSALNLNGGDSVIVAGELVILNGEEQNGSNSIYVTGKMVVKQQFQITDGSSSLIINSGSVDVGSNSSFNCKINAITLQNCGRFISEHIDVNSTSPFDGQGTVTFHSGSINNVFTLSNLVFVISNVSTTKWGKANVNSGTCSMNPLPVKVTYTAFTPRLIKWVDLGVEYEQQVVDYEIRLAEIDFMVGFEVEQTIDGKTWVVKVPMVKNNKISNTYIGRIYKPL